MFCFKKCYDTEKNPNAFKQFNNLIKFIDIPNSGIIKIDSESDKKMQELNSFLSQAILYFVLTFTNKMRPDLSTETIKEKVDIYFGTHQKVAKKFSEKSNF